ncbi:hypothetical protein SAMN05421787_103266 [Virgibacillus pantothenticus]|nr:hypothetical protein SAMN05421787_103266 [Virgibacillus pantothenticus]
MKALFTLTGPIVGKEIAPFPKQSEKCFISVTLLCY